jgi:membrane protease YdiL (CAAX protease family)
LRDIQDTRAAGQASRTVQWRSLTAIKLLLTPFSSSPQEKTRQQKTRQAISAHQLNTKLNPTWTISLWVLSFVFALPLFVALGLLVHIPLATLPGINVEPSEFESSISSAVLFILVSAMFVFMLQMGANKDAMARGDLSYGLRKSKRVFRSTSFALGARKHTPSELWKMLIVCGISIAVFVTLNGWLSHLPLPAEWAASPDDNRLPAIAHATPFIRAVNGFFHAPLWEEALFRGPIALTVFILNSGISKRHLNKRLSLVILVSISLGSTIIFGISHAPYGGLSVAIAMAFGAVAALTAIRFRSIVPGMVIHAFYNSVAFTI